jgi:hypothetical protein
MQYSGKEIAGLESHIDERVEEFCELINNKYLSEGPETREFDLAQTISYLTLDIITEIAFGDPFGFVKEDKDLWNYLKDLELGVSIMFSIGLLPWLSRLLKLPFMVSLVGRGPPSFVKIFKHVSTPRTSMTC